LLKASAASIATPLLAGPVASAPGEEHWHGAAPDRFMTHLAMLEVDNEGNAATCGEHVTDEEYGQQSG
jgi:hypothetical protein